MKKVKGYEKGINYKELSSAMPYMYTDKPEEIEFLAETSVIDQIIDWFGRDIRIMPADDETKVKVCIKASPKAMEHWAMQYINYVEITSPESLRTKIRDTLKAGLKKYK